MRPAGRTRLGRRTDIPSGCSYFRTMGRRRRPPEARPVIRLLRRVRRHSGLTAEVLGYLIWYLVDVLLVFSG